MKKKYSVGIIGTGFGKNVHAPAFRKHDQFELVGIASKNFDKAQHAAQALGGIKAFPTALDLILDPHIDVVSFAVPSKEQPALIDLAIQNKKHLFVEKPVGGGFLKAKQLADAALSAGLISVMNFEFPELDSWKKMKALLEQKAVGDLQHVLVSWHTNTVAHQSNPHSWKLQVAEGGGTLNNLCSHTFHYLEYFFGSIQSVKADLHLDSRGNDHLVYLNLKFESGVTALVSVSTNTAFGPEHRLEVFGSRGKLTLKNQSQDYMKGFHLAGRFSESQDLDFACTTPFDPKQDGRIEAVSRITKKLLEALNSGKPPDPNLGHGARVEFWLDQARRS